MARQSASRRIIAVAVALTIAWLPGSPAQAAPPDQRIVIDRDDYRDRLHAMWLGQTIANWTGLQTELTRNEPPFYTDDDWADIGFVTDQNPWLADDDTDLEYVYLHAASQARTPLLTSRQISDAWQRHINDFIWVSNARARELMRGGTLPPATSLGMANPDSLAIDAQLTTEFFGAFAPALPEQALRLADLPIRTTAEGHALHASQFFALLYSLAPRVDHLPEGEQPEALARLARRYLPNTSKAAGIVDFVLADFLANPDVDDWERTRDRIYRRYQLEATQNGFRYINAVESSINFAAGMMALLYGEGDYKRTVQIGTLSGWDSDNATATLGGLIGLLRGTDYIRDQFPGVDLADRYRIYRTRDDLPDYRPTDPDAEDTLTAMADRMIPLVERAIVDAGGSVRGGTWRLPKTAPAPDPSNPRSLGAANPTYDLFQRSANRQVRLAGGSVTVSSSVPGSAIDGGTADAKVLADGAETDFSGAERFQQPRYFTAAGNGGRATLTVGYDRVVTADAVRIVTGPAGKGAGLHDTRVQLRTPEGRWVDPAPGAFATAAVRGTMPNQIVDVRFGRTTRLTGVRLVGALAGNDRLAVAELDALAPARTEPILVEGPLTVTPRAVAALPGTTVDIAVNLPNTGSRAWSGILDLRLPRGWSSTGREAQVRQLRPGASMTHTFRVTVPAGAASGIGYVSVSARLGGVDLPAATTRIAVMAKTTSAVTARALEGNPIQLFWAGADPDELARYRIYGSTNPGFAVGPATLLGEAAEPSFTHLGPTLNTRWYYRVVAVDGAAKVGSPSKVASATSGSFYLIEAEQLLPPKVATKPVVRQSNCCGIQWSGGYQIRLVGTNAAAGDHVTLAFTMPEAGSFELVTTYTKAWNFGSHQLSVDGKPLGQPFDGYSPEVEVTDINHGPVQLAKGEHTLTLTVTGKNPSAQSFGLGLDKLQLMPT